MSSELINWTREHLARDFENQVREYLETILWSEHDESTPSGGEPLDRNYDVTDFALESIELAKKDLRGFEASVIEALLVLSDQAEENDEVSAFESELDGADWDSIGYHFWLSRVGHGVGFFDSEDKYGAFTEMLQDLAQKQGERYVYVGDDGRIYLE